MPSTKRRAAAPELASNARVTRARSGAVVAPTDISQGPTHSSRITRRPSSNRRSASRVLAPPPVPPMVEDEAGIGDANPLANVLAPEPVDGLSNQVVLLVSGCVSLKMYISLLLHVNLFHC